MKKLPKSLKLTSNNLSIVDKDEPGSILATVNNTEMAKAIVNMWNRENVDLNSLENLSDDVLAQAFTILFGKDWKRNWSNADKAREMRSISGGTSPSCPFHKWVETIKFLMEKGNEMKTENKIQYYTNEQISKQYNQLSASERCAVLYSALDFMQQSNTRTQFMCIALAMGYENEQGLNDTYTKKQD